MRQYELCYLISDEVDESELNKITGAVGNFVKESEGQIIKEEIWKRRKLAYKINRQDYATYVILNLELPRNKTIAFEKNLRHTARIIRHLLIVKEAKDEALTLMPDEIVGMEEIEKAIGGEKSFEAVIGETKESKDLMSLREEAAAKTEPESKAANEPAANEEPAKEKPKTKKKVEKPENEADRLAKLDEQLDDILNDEL